MEQRKLTYVEPKEYFSKEMLGMLLQDDNKRIRNFVSRYPWTFAKTYATFAPHEYYVKEKLDVQGQEEFIWFVEFIRDYGFECKFAGKTHTYYEIDGHYYWTMGNPIDETFILNRCKVEDYVIRDESMIYRKKEEEVINV